MQRVRIGLTGLAFVFILVLLGAIFARPSAEEPAVNLVGRLTGHGGPPAAAPAVNETGPKEPLAQLGVAPGNADENGAAAANGQ